jgi:predicted AAA+ superfamily ATPase
MIDRLQHLHTVRQLLEHNPVVAILGARQVGKTTLARRIAGETSKSCTFFDLEDPRTVARLSDATGRVEMYEIGQCKNI